MKVSVIIPTYNRAHKVLQTVLALQNQQYTEFDIIVVVDGSQDNTVELLATLQPRIPVRTIEQLNSGRAASRNAGVEATDAELLIFYDDDTIPEQHSVGGHVTFHKTNVSAAILGGNPAEYRQKTKTDFQNYKAFLCERWLAPYEEGRNRLRFDNLFLSGANFSIKRGAFIALNGFSIFLKDNEDFDLAYRALENNMEVWFDYNNIAIHDDPVTCEGYVRRLRQYVRSHKAANSRYMRARRIAAKRDVIRIVVYTFFSFNFWIYVIDQFNFFRILPESIRYRLYDIITFSHSQK